MHNFQQPLLKKHAQETFLNIINAENSCAAEYFCGNCDTFINWLIDWLIDW